MTARHAWSDEYLHHWGEVFTANAAIRRWYEERGLGDVAFESFLADPQAVMEAIAFGLPVPLPDGQEFYPLLSVQESVRLRLILMELAERGNDPEAFAAERHRCAQLGVAP
jgi:hypothetical protein